MSNTGENRAATTRIYVGKTVNEKVDTVHLRIMNRIQRKISKTDFIEKALEIGLDNEDGLCEMFKVAG